MDIGSTVLLELSFDISLVLVLVMWLQISGSDSQELAVVAFVCCP